MKYLHPEKVTIAVGNADEIKEDMKQFGDVEVFDDVE